MAHALVFRAAFALNMHVFVTVGTTRFDALVSRVLEGPVLRALHQKGHITVTLQIGKSQVPSKQEIQSIGDKFNLDIYDYKPLLQSIDICNPSLYPLTHECS